MLYFGLGEKMSLCKLKGIQQLEGSERRSALAVCIEILGIAREGILKTHLIYGTNSNFSRMKHFLNNLEKMGLVEHGEFIKTTKKGLAIYEYFKKANDELLTSKNTNNL